MLYFCPMEESQRQKKIGGVLQKDLADVLQRAASDGGLMGTLISVTKVSVTVDLSVKISGSAGADEWVYFSGSAGADEWWYVVGECNHLSPDVWIYPSGSAGADKWVYISGSAGADKWVCISNPNQLDQEMLETLGLR